MRSPNRYLLVTIWIGLALLAPGLCLMHALPHAHAEEAHSHPHPESAPVPIHAHEHGHAHDHAHDSTAPMSPEPAHHHHTLDDHFEADPIRPQGRQQDTNHGSAIAITAEVDSPTNLRDAAPATTEPDLLPDRVTLAVGGPRAPPIQY